MEGNMKKTKLFAVIALAAFSASIVAQENKEQATSETEVKTESFKMKGPDVSGYVEASGTWNFTQKKGAKRTNELRSYDSRSNTFYLNAAHVAINGESSDGKVSYAVEIDGGSDAYVNKDSALGSGYVDLQEAYLTYQFANWLSLTSGKFATFQGIEVIEGPENPTVSRGYLYGLAEAFTLTGMYFEITPVDMLSIKLGGANDWDTMVDTNDEKTFISQIGLDFGDPLSFVISTFVGGSVADLSVDLTGVTKISSFVDLNFQANYGEKEVAAGIKSKWAGAGLQPVFHLSSTFDLGIRYELWNPNKYKSGYKDANGNDVKLLAHNITITPTWMPSPNVKIRPEFRVDFADQEIFYKDATSKSKTNLTASLGTSVSF